ncbi:mucin-like glycoprotein [Trypanosoma conorhini]|uniref:Mucin-like glycoprotein n=1 Tax=Trypanosoma conorhini TaxID=83891 RepID=A0A3R7LHU8_9TRYP|nr:mucin-like glycoprotein [Trypanosoma conorhini]RNE97556.1 mucin-like glycoprotein [Trypanosoma conorhini]
MAKMAAVRRRAVCALALLALLCGPFCVAAAAASSAEEEVDVSVQISCADSDNKLSWRFPGEGAWQKCAFTVDESFTMSGAIHDDENSLCAWAGTQYSPFRSASGSVCSGATAENDLAFTMRCKTKKNSGAYKRWQSVCKQPGGAAPAAVSGGEPLGVLQTCTMQPSSGNAAEEGPDAPQGGSQEDAGGAQLKGTPEGGKGTQLHDEPEDATGPQGAQQLAGVGAAANTEGKAAEPPRGEDQRGAEEVPAGAGPGRAAGPTVQQPAESATQSAGTAAAPGTVDVQPAHGVESKPQTAESAGASDAPPKPGAQPQAGGELAEGGVGGATGQAKAAEGSEEEREGAERTTTTGHGSDSTNPAQSTAGATQASAPKSATNSSATQKTVANSADSTATNALLLRAPLLLLSLLLTAVLACAAA